MAEISLLDPNMIQRLVYDEEHRANRVVVVAGEVPSISVSSGSQSQEVRIEKIEVPTIVIQKEVQVVELEKQVVVIEREIELVEIPTIVKEIELIKVEVPVIVKEFVEVIKEVPVIQTQVQIIEKPVIVTQTEYKDLPIWIKICLVTQIVVSIISSLKMIK